MDQIGYILTCTSLVTIVNLVKFLCFAADTKMAETLIEFVTPIRERQIELLSDKKELVRILDEGSKHAREVAEKKMVEVRKALGISL